MSILQIQGLYKKFGQNNIINGLDLEVRENTIFGFIGENGAGKTTTMKMILGFLKRNYTWSNYKNRKKCSRKQRKRSKNC